MRETGDAGVYVCPRGSASDQGDKRRPPEDGNSAEIFRAMRKGTQPLNHTRGEQETIESQQCDAEA